MGKAALQRRPVASPSPSQQTKAAGATSPLAAQLAQLHAMAQASPQAHKLAQLKAIANSHATAQRAGAEEEEPLQGKFATAQRAGADEEELLQGKFATAQRAGAEEEEPLQGKFATAQRAGVDEEEPLQGKFATAQRAGAEEEELLQGKFATAQRAGADEEELLQGKFATAQRAGADEEELLQGKFATAQRAGADEEALQRKAHAAPQANQTGLPNQLKSGIESLSGMSLDHVRVHYNSPQPAQLNAHAYAQGTDIHVAPGQEKHLPHEAWHVVQQAQGRVKPTMQMKSGVPVNDDVGLEQEADNMGSKALAVGQAMQRQAYRPAQRAAAAARVAQLKGDKHYWVRPAGGNWQYVGRFKNHKTANNWWAANKSNYPGGMYSQGNSARKFK